MNRPTTLKIIAYPLVFCLALLFMNLKISRELMLGSLIFLLGIVVLIGGLTGKLNERSF